MTHYVVSAVPKHAVTQTVVADNESDAIDQAKHNPNGWVWAEYYREEWVYSVRKC